MVPVQKWGDKKNHKKLSRIKHLDARNLDDGKYPEYLGGCKVYQLNGRTILDFSLLFLILGGKIRTFAEL